jgi:hypothetical protein
MNLLLRMVDGFRLTADVYTAPRAYPHRPRTGFASDATRLLGDVRVVGKDVKISIKRIQVEQRDGEQAHTGEGAVFER